MIDITHNHGDMYTIFSQPHAHNVQTVLCSLQAWQILHTTMVACILSFFFHPYACNVQTVTCSLQA